MMRKMLMLALMMSAGALQAKPLVWVGGNVGATGENDELKSGIIGGGQFGVTGKHLGTSLAILRYDKDTKGESSSWLSKGSFVMTPVMLNVFGRLPIEGVGAARLGGGLSYVNVSHSLDASVTEPFRMMGFGVKEEVDSGIGYQVNGGIDFWLNENLSLGADIIYLFFKPEATATIWSLRTGAASSNKADVKLDTLMGMMTIKYHFK